MLTIRVLHVVLWLLVVSGPATALVLAARVSAMNHQLNEVATRPAIEPSGETAGAEGFAELFVAAYLAGDQGDSAGPQAQVDGLSSDHTVGCSSHLSRGTGLREPDQLTTQRGEKTTGKASPGSAGRADPGHSVEWAFLLGIW